MIDFVHPGELTAWNKLTENKIFQYAADIFHTIYTDMTAFASMKGRNFLVTERTMPEVYHLYQTAAQRLGIASLPPLYLQAEYAITIRTVGTDGDCAILLNSACLEECSENQILALLGQELAHVRCRHLRVLNMDTMLDTILTKLPMVGPVAAQSLKTLLLQWKEYAYYTADRGAAIAAGGKLPVYQNLTQAMGYRLDEDGVKSVLCDAAKKDTLPAEQSASAKVVLQMMISGITVPFGMWRLRELDAWEENPEAYIPDSEMIQVEMGTLARKTVSAMDIAAKGLYHGTRKTAEAVKTGKEELEAYVETNRPIWEKNLAEAREKTTETVRSKSKEVKSYLKDKAPEWKDNLTSVTSGTAQALQSGAKGLTDHLSGMRNKHAEKEPSKSSAQKTENRFRKLADKLKRP